ncbi:MAG: hypothetical protein HGA93_00205 [Methanothrix sp.]|nr:hypothetical protein [Methanothrix sp.]
MVSAEENTSLLNNTTVDVAMNVSLNDTLNATTGEPMNAISNETIVSEPNGNLNDFANELNQTGLNETLPDLNEVVPVENVAIEENATSEVMQANNASVTTTVSQPTVFQVGSSEDTIFSIGSGLASNDIFQINGNAESQKPFEVDLPAKPVKDLSKVIFTSNII